MKNEFRYCSIVTNNELISLEFDKKLKIKNVRIEGNDLVIPESSFPHKDFISVSKKMNFLNTSLDTISSKIYNSVPKVLKDELDTLIIRDQPKFFLDPSLGRLARLFDIKNQLFCNTSNHHLKILKEETLPFMRNEMKCKYLTLVNIDTESFIKLVRFSKILFLFQTHQNPKVIQEKVDQDVLEKILLDSNDILTLIGSLTRSVPFTLTLPVQYNISCHAHFYAEAMHNFSSSIYTSSFYENFLIPISPHSKSHYLCAFDGVKRVNDNFISLYLQSIGSGINKTLNYITNPANFLDEKDCVNLTHTIQINISLKLIFADFAQLALSSDHYRTQTFCLSLLDKVANLIVQGDKSKKEDLFFKKVLSEEYKNHLKLCLKNGLFRKVQDEFIEILETSHIRAVKEFKSKLRANTQDETAEYFRLLRNTKHGAFLNNLDHVNKVFLDSDCIIPQSIVTITFITVLAMVIDFEEFLKLKNLLK